MDSQEVLHSSKRRFWMLPLPAEDILFVESAQCAQFEQLMAALERAYMVGMDAEWKPVRVPLASPRVAILQLSIRFRESVVNCERSVSLSREEEGDALFVEREAIFLLDMMALPAVAISAGMKTMLSSRNVLKLGFGFKQDLLHLAASFPGPDARGCFDKVEPYLDIGQLWLQLRGRSIVNKAGRSSSFGRETSLSSICEAVLGLPLCKDVQCSNWELRPLSVEQVSYAAADAHVLLLIFDSLQMDSLQHMEEERRIMVPATPLLRTSLVGLAVLLEDDEQRHAFGTGSMLRVRWGFAQHMVEAALSSCACQDIMEEANLPKHLRAIAARFGERLVVNEPDGSRKPARKKVRSRQARQAAQKQLKKDEVVSEEEGKERGPWPWDASVGGDGVPKFLCDVMIEGLARHLRCVGIDAAFPCTRKSNPRQLVEQAEREGRVLLTRDSKLLRRRLVPDTLSYRVKSSVKQDQLLEVLECFEITVSAEQLLSRCIKCNGMFSPHPLSPSEAMAAAVATGQLLPYCVVDAEVSFWQCRDCHHLYWQGSQFARAMEQFSRVVLGPI